MTEFDKGIFLGLRFAIDKFLQPIKHLQDFQEIKSQALASLLCEINLKEQQCNG